jgi:hypothetical protein
LSLHTDAASTGPPDAFGPFRVLHQIGAGASGPVFRAYDPDNDRLVAVKLFRLDLPPERVHRLVAELERLIAVRLPHPAVVAPIATGMVGVRAYLAQDYVAAESLDVTVRQGPVAASDALQIAGQLAGALDAAAAAGIDHGVMHPRDVLLSGDEGRLTGLGLARALAHVGVPAPVRRPYTAPERIAGSTWDRRADVFGLAALLHEMLWARRVAALGDEAAASLTEIPGGDLGRLRAVFGRALASDPGIRFDTAVQFAGALQEAFPTVASVVRSVRPQPDRNQRVRLKADTTNEGDEGVRSVRLQPDRKQKVRQKVAATPEGEPRLPLDAAADAAHVPIVDEPATLVEERRYADVEPAPAAAYSAAPPVALHAMMDPHHEEPDAPKNARPQSSITPLAFALVIGAALGFAAGFGVGTRGQPEEPGDLSRTAATPAGANGETAAATSGSAREFTEATVPAAQPVAPPRSTAPPRTTVAPRGAVPQSPAPAAPIVGSLLVRSTPLGARVFVDGREYGRTPVTVAKLARGAHRVRVTRDGYAPDERRVTITPAQRTHSITVRLSPERPATAAIGAQRALPAPTAEARGTGQLTVESRPAGAQIFLDGRLVGTTPLLLNEVPVGDHALHLERDGYQRWSSAIRIAPSKPNRVAASLDR